MYKPYDYGEPIDEDGYRAKPRSQPHEDIISASSREGFKKPSRWVFISRKADLGIILVLALGAGLGIMWFISQLPVFVETASNHYHWAMDVYATWGTPSMRWLFINLVVGVIVATSGLLSAFGGDRSAPEPDRSVPSSGYDKGVSYRGAEPGASYGGADRAYNASEARFTGPGYESPLYNPYVDEPAKERLHHEGSFEAWNRRGDNSSVRGDRGREGIHGRDRVPEPPPFARPVDPEVVRAAKPVSRQGSQRRGVPIPADEGVPMSRELPREMFETPPRGVEREVARGMPPMESFGDLPREMPPMEESPPPPPEAPVSSEVPPTVESSPVAEAAAPPPPEPVPVQPEVVSEGLSASGSFKEDAVEIISKVYDPVPEDSAGATDHHKFQRMKTDSGIHYAASSDEASNGSSPAKPDMLHKSHTFTLGRVLRRDQLADFMEPLSRKLEGIGRKVHKSSHSESRELPVPPPIDAAGSSATSPSESQRRRRSSEAIPGISHSRRLSSESVPSSDAGFPPNLPKLNTAPVIPSKFPSIVPKPSPPPSPPILKQRSIVYPPALHSQASTAAEEEVSPPGSPPIEKAIPPPPPPHLKLPPAKDGEPTSSITSSEELPSFKFYVPPSKLPDAAPPPKPPKKQAEKASSSEDAKKPPSGKHSRTPSSVPSTSSQPTGAGATGVGSSTGPEDRSLIVMPGKSMAGEETPVQEAKEEQPSLDRQASSSSAKDDDLHQQIEDFLARFHENWRLQRQESLARYKKRLVELDD